MTIRAIVENENTLPDSVHYTLNGEAVIQIPRLNTDWYTYMGNDCHTGFSESPAPMDNTILWSAPVTGDDHEFPTPVVVDGIVYYPQDSSGDSLYALDAATGEILWTYKTGYTDDAVTVKNGLLYTSSDSLLCLDALTGERVWGFGISGSASSPVVYGESVFGCHPSAAACKTLVHSLDAVTGEENWDILFAGYAASCNTAWNDMLFVPTYYGPLYAIDTNTGSVIWENSDSQTGYWDSSPVIVDGMLYILGDDSKARAIDPFSGSVVWEMSITPGTYLSATPAFYDGSIFFGDQVDSFHRLNALDGSFEWSVPGVDHGSAGIADGIVFYGEGSNYYDQTARVFALSCETGAEVWSYETSSGPLGIVSSPSITDGVMYIACTDWNLYAFGTGLKYTYLDDLYAQLGQNELIVTSFDGGAVAADTISFTVTGAGINLNPSRILNLAATPNPFISTASISFELSETGFTSVEIFDLSGRLVTSLADSEMLQGNHSIQWNTNNNNREEVSAGLYLCRVESVGVVETIGLCLLR